jgi:exodeoxyribonuclease VII large subunit
MQLHLRLGRMQTVTSQKNDRLMLKDNKDTDLFVQPEIKDSPKHVYTVSQITQDIKLILENAFGEVWVEGEVSNFATAGGHFYFSLKDDAAILPAVMFSRANRELKFKIENGQKIICFGKISAWGPSGKFQIIAEKIEPKGIGSLQLALEQLKQKLEKEGLFASQHKRPIPYLPYTIGIVTSLSGAAIKDILKVLDRRFSDVRIIINSCQVQGEQAKEEIAGAIAGLNLLNEDLPPAEKIEVMIVGRGGGSTEDLWAFNEEIVARAIYNSKIPVISAVGHERDWTISDLVSDLRAPTPSVAAEFVTPKREDLKEKLSDLFDRAKGAFADITENFRRETGECVYRLNLKINHVLELSSSGLSGTQKKLSLLNPVLKIKQYKIEMEGLARQIYVRIQHLVELRQAEFEKSVEKLSSLSPLNILARGYSITFKMPELSIIKGSESLKLGDTLKTRLHQGEILSRVTEVKKNG